MLKIGSLEVRNFCPSTFETQKCIWPFIFDAAFLEIAIPLLYFSSMKIVILGFGKVGQHLLKAFLNAPEIEVVQIYNRSPISLKGATAFTTHLASVMEADIYLLAIPDDEISNFSEELPFRDKLLVHTSGSVDVKALSKRNRRGIFYPLQTFTKERAIDFKSVPICIEAEHTSDLKQLQALGDSISNNVVEISSSDRRILHLAAVFVNNFSNHLYGISEAILNRNELNFDLLKPLIMETAAKIEQLSPSEAQTGPAKRYDQNTIKKHLEMLTNNNDKALYELFTKAIQQKTHSEK